MTLEQFVNFLVLLLGTIGSIYVLKSYLEQTPEITRELASSRYGGNLDLLEAMSAQKTDGVAGTGLVVITLVIAVINLIVAPSQVVVFDNKLYAIPFGTVIGASVYFLLNKVSKKLYRKHLRAAVCIIANRTLDRVFEKNNIPYFETKALLNLRDKYFQLEIPPSTTSREFIERLANYLNRSVPDKIEIEEVNK